MQQYNGLDKTEEQTQRNKRQKAPQQYQQIIDDSNPNSGYDFSHGYKLFQYYQYFFYLEDNFFLIKLLKNIYSYKLFLKFIIFQ